MTLVNAFGGLAQEHPNSAGDAHLVAGNKVRWRKEFNDPTLADWVVSTGTGQTVTVSNSNLLITTGTTANAQTTVMSKQTFSVPFKIAFGFQISQKIANQEFYVEVVADDGNGGADETVVAAWRIAGSDSVTATNARTEVRNGGAARVQSANIASQASQTTGAIYEIVLESDETWFHSRLADSVAGRSTSSVKNTTSPDPTRKFHARFRVVNGATAPASNTTFTSAFVTSIDYTEFQVEVTGGQGSISAGQAVPVYSTGGSTTVANATIASSASVTGLSVQKLISAATTNATLVKSSAGRVYGYQLANTSASWRYVKFYNKATAPTVGTDVPLHTLPLAPNTTTDLNLTIPITHATGIGIAVTGSPADNDATAIGAGEVVGTIFYA